MDIIDEGRVGIRGVASVRLDGIIDWSPSGELIGFIPDLMACDSQEGFPNTAVM